MAEIINLRQERKRRARAAKAEKAAQNRVTHGLSKPTRETAQREQERDSKHHQGKRLDRDDERD